MQRISFASFATRFMPKRELGESVAETKASQQDEALEKGTVQISNEQLVHISMPEGYPNEARKW